MGEVPIAPYETPGGQDFANTVLPFLKPGTNTIILANHGTISFGKTLEEAYWKTEILDAYCRILLLSKQLGGVTYLNEQKSRELLDLKKRLGFDDPRFHVEDCDLCGNGAYRDGYKEEMPQPCAFEPAPTYPGYLQKPTYAGGSVASSSSDVEGLVKAITEQVLAAMGSK